MNELVVFVEKNDIIWTLSKEYGYKVINFYVAPPNIKHDTETIDNVDGEMILETKYGSRRADLEFVLIGRDNVDSTLFNEESLKIFLTKQSFHIWSNRTPGKRLFVRCDNLEYERISSKLTKVKVGLISYSPYIESFGTTLTSSGFDVDKWQFGQGLETMDYKYVHNTSKFVIYNAGDVDIDPRCIPLTITFKGSSTNIEIRNKTTGDVFKLNGSTGANDTLLLEGVKAFVNGSNVFAYTNHKLITLAPGENEFEILNGYGTITFDFKFYYLA